MVWTVISEALLNRARDRCSQHRDINGFCPCCLEFVLAETMVEENPELCMDDAINVVSGGVTCIEFWGYARIKFSRSRLGCFASRRCSRNVESG